MPLRSLKGKFGVSQFSKGQVWYFSVSPQGKFGQTRLHITIIIVLRSNYIVLGFRIHTIVRSLSCYMYHEIEHLKMFNHSSDIVELFLTPAKSDAIIFWVVSTLLLTKAIWSRYLPINDHIPESFWHIVPQHHNNGKADVAELVQSRNIRDAFTIGVRKYQPQLSLDPI